MPTPVPGSASTFPKVKITVSSSSAIFSSNLRCDGRVSHFFLHPKSECSAVTRFTQSISDDWCSPDSGLSRGSEKFSRWKMSRSPLTGLWTGLPWLVTPLILTEQRREMMDQPSQHPQSREDAELTLKALPLCPNTNIALRFIKPMACKYNRVQSNTK